MTPRPASACLAALSVALLLAGCGSAPTRPGTGASAGGVLRPPRPAPPPDVDRDGPEARPPADLHRVPDAQPRLEPVRSGGPNKPYEVLGQAYAPLSGDPALIERGLASWYGRKFHGRPTANGETYDRYAMTGAHKTMPLPSYARVRNPANGREVVVRVNDRGPFHGDRVIDLSYTAALRLGLLGGVAPVEVERITYEAIRSGAWRSPPPASGDGAPPLPATALAAGPAPVPADDPIAEIVARRSAPGGLPPLPAAPPAGQPVASAADGSAAAPALKSARGFWLQLGAFRDPRGAVGFRHQVARDADWLAPLLAIFSERQLHRLQAGPYASRADAGQAAERLRQALQLVPAIVERR